MMKVADNELRLKEKEKVEKVGSWKEISDLKGGNRKRVLKPFHAAARAMCTGVNVLEQL